MRVAPLPKPEGVGGWLETWPNRPLNLPRRLSLYRGSDTMYSKHPNKVVWVGFGFGSTPMIKVEG